MSHPTDSPASRPLEGLTPAFQLEFVGADGVVSRHLLSARPFHIGRGAANDLILMDDAASSRHVRVWAEGAGVRVEDLGSRNGTWLNGARLQGTAPFGLDDEVTIGAAVRLRVCQVEEGEGLVPLVEDLDLGLRHAFRSDRFSIADTAVADIRVPGAGAGCTLLLDRDGDVWLGRDEDLTHLDVNQPFAVGGRNFQLCRYIPEEGTTRELIPAHELTPARYAYAIEARLEGPTGPEATFREARTGISHTIVAANPALLVYLLSRQHITDRTAGVAPVDRGWMGDRELAVGIWGRGEAARQGINLNVLIWRVRRELQSAGLDPWCLEKRRKHTRLRVDGVQLV